MARDIDRLIEYIRTLDYLSPTEKEVLVARVDYKPTHEEIYNARVQLGYYERPTNDDVQEQ
jgi:hypothetical protein